MSICLLLIYPQGEDARRGSLCRREGFHTTAVNRKVNRNDYGSGFLPQLYPFVFMKLLDNGRHLVCSFSLLLSPGELRGRPSTMKSAANMVRRPFVCIAMAGVWNALLSVVLRDALPRIVVLLTSFIPTTRP